MAYLNTIIELEGTVLDVRPRYWRAHQEAAEAVGVRGVEEQVFWRLIRMGARDSELVPHAKPAQVAEYLKKRQARFASSELMALDELLPDARTNLSILKQMGRCCGVTLSDNREGMNATLDRLDIWLFFEHKQALPEHRERRVRAIADLRAGMHSTLAIAGTVPFAYSAGEADCRVVGMKTSLAFPRQLRQVGVDVIYDSLDQLTDALSQRAPELQKLGIC